MKKSKGKKKTRQIVEHGMTQIVNKFRIANPSAKMSGLVRKLAKKLTSQIKADLKKLEKRKKKIITTAKSVKKIPARKK